MKIILDTNVLISLSLGGGPTLQRIGAAWLAGEVQVIISEELLDEYAGVANRPHLLARFETADRVQEFVRDLRVAGELVSIHEPYPDAPDENDRFLFALARAGSAEVLVTGDRALLELRQFEETAILSPRDFIEKLGG